MSVIVTAALAALAVLATASCSGNAGAEPPPELGPLPQIRSQQELVLPLDYYLPTPRERAVLATARSEVTAACMEKLGFTGYPVESFRAQAVVPLHGNTYGVIDASIAQTYGYRASFDQVLLDQSDDLSERFADWGSAEVLTSLRGAQRGPSALPQRGAGGPSGVPEGGCDKAAPAELYASVDAPPPQQINWIDTLRANAYGEATADERLVPVTAAWSACMKQAGYDYAAPGDANEDPQWSPLDSAAAKRVAVADVACKRSSRYLDTYVALSAAYETRAVEKNAERLQNELDARKRLLGAIAAQGLGRIRDVGEQ